MSATIPSAVATQPSETEAKDSLELINELRHFTGGGDNHQHWTRRTAYTDGVRYLAEKAGAYWLIDVIVSHQPAVLQKIRAAGDRNFQVWEVVVYPDRKCKVTCHNGNGGDDKEIYKVQRIEYTDFPLVEFKLYCADGVILLPSEY